MTRTLVSAAIAAALFTLVLGLGYPAAMTGIAQVTFPDRADGSLVERDGQVVGSRLAAQAFTRPEYFHPRPSAVDYDAAGTSFSNLGPTSPDLAAARVESLQALFHAETFAANVDEFQGDLVAARARYAHAIAIAENIADNAGMLALSVYLGVADRDYLDPNHPVQQMNKAALADLAGVDADDIPIAVDGCGVPTFALPLRQAAHAFARLLDPFDLDAGRVPAIERVVDAMRQYPEMVAGDERLDTWLMQTAPNLVTKGGAEGFQGIGVLRDGQEVLGIAVKVADGDAAARAKAPVVIETLAQTGSVSSDVIEQGRHWRYRCTTISFRPAKLRMDGNDQRRIVPDGFTAVAPHTGCNVTNSVKRIQHRRHARRIRVLHAIAKDIEQFLRSVGKRGNAGQIKKAGAALHRMNQPEYTVQRCTIRWISLPRHELA